MRRNTRPRLALRRSGIVAVLLLVNCFPPVEVTPPPADAPAEVVALAGAAVLVGAGDIAVCGTQYDEATAAIIDSVARDDSVAKVEDVVFTAGDNWYPDGAKAYHDQCWAPSWGDKQQEDHEGSTPGGGKP